MIEEETLSSRELRKLVCHSKQAYLCRFEVKDIKKEVRVEEDNNISGSAKELLRQFNDKNYFRRIGWNNCVF